MPASSAICLIVVPRTSPLAAKARPAASRMRTLRSAALESRPTWRLVGRSISGGHVVSVLSGVFRGERTAPRPRHTPPRLVLQAPPAGFDPATTDEKAYSTERRRPGRTTFRSCFRGQREAKVSVVLITGCSTGIGLHASVAFGRNGDTVVATMRNTSKADALRKAAADAGSRSRCSSST